MNLSKKDKDFYNISLSLFHAATLLREHNEMFSEVLLGQSNYFLEKVEGSIGDAAAIINMPDTIGESDKTEVVDDIVKEVETNKPNVPDAIRTKLDQLMGEKIPMRKKGKANDMACAVPKNSTMIPAGPRPKEVREGAVQANVNSEIQGYMDQIKNILAEKG